MRIHWDLLLDEHRGVRRMMSMWSVGQLSSRDVRAFLSNGEFAGEFRKLLENYGTVYGRRLARKALSYRVNSQVAV